MLRILNNCNQIQKSLKCCHDAGSKCYCYDCLRKGFYGGSDSYSCLKKLCHYVMNYGPAYVSEIYHFLGASKILERVSEENINVLSLGCGFGPDYVALNKYIYDKKLKLRISYYGYDQERKWQDINKGIIENLPIKADILNGLSLNKYHIIFLNKIFSTLLKNGLVRPFFDRYMPEVKNNMRVGAILVFNDINHYKMGRDVFDKFISTVLQNDGRYYFNVDGAYSGNYIEIPYTNNICRIPDGLPFIPKDSVTKSVFFVYRKIN